MKKVSAIIIILFLGIILVIFAAKDIVAKTAIERG